MNIDKVKMETDDILEASKRFEQGDRVTQNNELSDLVARATTGYGPKLVRIGHKLRQRCDFDTIDDTDCCAIESTTRKVTFLFERPIGLRPGVVVNTTGERIHTQRFIAEADAKIRKNLDKINQSQTKVLCYNATAAITSLAAEIKRELAKELRVVVLLPLGGTKPKEFKTNLISHIADKKKTKKMLVACIEVISLQVAEGQHTAQLVAEATSVSCSVDAVVVKARAVQPECHFVCWIAFAQRVPLPTALTLSENLRNSLDRFQLHLDPQDMSSRNLHYMPFQRFAPTTRYLDTHQNSLACRELGQQFRTGLESEHFQLVNSDVVGRYDTFAEARAQNSLNLPPKNRGIWAYDWPTRGVKRKLQNSIASEKSRRALISALKALGSDVTAIRDETEQKMRTSAQPAWKLRDVVQYESDVLLFLPVNTNVCPSDLMLDIYAMLSRLKRGCKAIIVGKLSMTAAIGPVENRQIKVVY